ncbi:MAG: hypothetical protein V4850_31555 [Myxococcota bacterium]
MTLLFLVFACASPSAPVAPVSTASSAEGDRPFAGTGTWDLEGRAITLTAGTLYADGLPILAHVYGDPVAGEKVLWVPADPGEGDGGIYAVRIHDGEALVMPLLTTGRPDRLALSPDGATLVYVGGHSGIASVWAVPTVAGAPRQLTNVGVLPTPGGAPEGFVPPPERGPVRFDGARIVWTAEGAERTATWR